MARVTVEDCLEQEENRFALVVLVAGFPKDGHRFLMCGDRLREPANLPHCSAADPQLDAFT